MLLFYRLITQMSCNKIFKKKLKITMKENTGKNE